MGIFYVYILKCIDKNGQESLYTGSTQDLMQRVGQHQKGHGARYTKGRELSLAYFETFQNRSEAMKREYEIKNYTAAQKQAIIQKFEGQLKEGAKSV